MKGGPSPDNTDEQEKVKSEAFFGTLSFWGDTTAGIRENKLVCSLLYRS